MMSEDYWNSERKMRSISVGYSNNWAGVTYNLNYSYNENTTDTDNKKVYDKDQIFSFNINVPFDLWSGNNYATYSLNTSKHGSTSHNLGMNGSTLADNNLNWNIQQSQTNHGEGNGGYASLDYQGTYARVNSAYSYDRDQHRVNYGIDGGLVAHANGLTFSQELGETAALVEAPGADGVTVMNQTGVKTDFRGYTIVPYISPYRESVISLDTATLPDNADVELTSQTVTPTRGAIVRTHFATHVGKRVLMTLIRRSGGIVPFGAMVSINGVDKPSGSIVGDGGQVYLTGMPTKGTATAKWGQTASEQCEFLWQLPDVVPASGVAELTSSCQ